MKRTLRGAVVAVVVLAMALPALIRPESPRAQGVEINIDVGGTGQRKLNIAVPDFTITTGADPSGLTKTLAQIAGADLDFSGLFSVVTPGTPLPADGAEAFKQALAGFASAGAHAVLHGLVAVRGERLEGEMRLWDLASASEPRQISSKTFAVAAAQSRRLAHKMADEVVLQFTGELGVADTKIAYATGRPGAKEIVVADYDGFAPAPVTRNGSINLTPVWSPDARSLAYTSYKNGYPDLFRLFPFERRPEQTLAAFSGINSSPAWSPDGQQLALTLSKDGNPEIYVLSIATGVLRRLTRHAGIDTEPTWSPTGRQLAFISNRAGSPHVFVMDAEGANVRQLTFGGYQTQPRWSPKGDTIAYTARHGTFDVWAVQSDGSNARRLTAGPGDNQGSAWSPNGRHLMFQSNRLGGWQIFSMLADGTAQAPVTRGTGERTSPSWSPRLP
ncbi:MAG: Tol-Pal system beta propeller repeat protein TolB [Candidatus Rokubacteria bacterium]|nr:Tol-Pal system beta propeller repeat protein TolB [Candidatus Rokubacteria bacterium]